MITIKNVSILSSIKTFKNTWETGLVGDKRQPLSSCLQSLTSVGETRSSDAPPHGPEGGVGNVYQIMSNYRHRRPHPRASDSKDKGYKEDENG